MTRLIVYLLASLLVAAFSAWLIALPGTVSIDVGTYRLQPSLGAAIFALVLLIGFAIVLWGLVRRVIGLPDAIARRNEKRRFTAGLDALSDGLIALEAGDHARARTLARDAQSKLPDNAAARLLEARAQLALGAMGEARERYRALLADDKTALAALSGLYEQARLQARPTAAIAFARKALTLAPDLDWASRAVFDDLTGREEWTEALEMAERLPARTRGQKAAGQRRRGVLHAALARSRETSDPDSALEHAKSALKLLPDFVPPALIAARVYINKADTKKASRLLKRTWQSTGHPDAANLYVHVQPGASALDRLDRARALLSDRTEDRAAAIVLARAAIDAYEWATARNALAPHAAKDPTQTVCVLMAEIEEGQSGDQGRARQWLARAVDAPRDPVWTADGLALDEWAPVSPETGRLDAFEWKSPVTSRPVKAIEQDSDTAPPAAEAMPQALASAPHPGPDTPERS
ncbi:heme biosynthesis protein HemY [Pelagibacterium montanilacus]|uniref:heme biosynthesis protein HemY n=1 Tax=Pelagibacterium montanilacus TaxID=2185280 RepID=UPI000F8D2765|nr:heme biosynthesis HemY N-terminal domain-containing protein [Pelagibacterium montanilacus]